MSAPGRPICVGNHQRSLDSKNRLTIPSRWRFEGDTVDAYLALPDHGSESILVLPPAQASKLFDRIEEGLMGDDETQRLQMTWFSSSDYMSCDKQGRVMLPADLIAYAGIDKEAILVGGMVNFRIWSPERWALLDPKKNKTDRAALARQAGI